MLKSILEKAIGEEIGDGYVQEYSLGYNLAKAEMRAKMPQVVEEVKQFIMQNFGQIDYKGVVYKIENGKFEDVAELEDIIKSLTVENSAQKEDKEI